MEDKISLVKIFDYLIKKCNHKTTSDLEALTTSMNEKASSGIIAIRKFDHNGEDYYGVWTEGLLGRAYGAVFKIEDDDILNLIGSSEIHVGETLGRSDSTIKALKTRFIDKHDTDIIDDHNEENDTTSDSETVQERNGIKYKLIDHSSRGGYNSIYGSDNIIIEVVDNTPEADVRAEFGGPLTEISKIKDNVYSITYYRD